MGKRKLDKVAAECLWGQIMDYTVARVEAELTYQLETEEAYRYSRKEAYAKELVLQDIFAEATGWVPVLVKEEDYEETKEYWKLK